MSINTDIASLKIIAAFYQSQNLKQTYQELVHNLQTHVAYFDWVGLYIKYGEEMILEAASNMEHEFTWETNAELRIPIENKLEKEIGKIVVRSRQPICFDMTDVSTLKTLAAEISQRLTMN